MILILRLAELLLALVFVLGGLATLRDPQPRAEQLVRFRLPFPMLLVRLNAAVMVAAGLALALNIRPTLASIILAAVLLPTTLFGHAFWTEDGAGRQQQLATVTSCPAATAWRTTCPPRLPVAPKMIR